MADVRRASLIESLTKLKRERLEKSSDDALKIWFEWKACTDVINLPVPCCAHVDTSVYDISFSSASLTDAAMNLLKSDATKCGFTFIEFEDSLIIRDEVLEAAFKKISW